MGEGGAGALPPPPPPQRQPESRWGWEGGDGAPGGGDTHTHGTGPLHFSWWTSEEVSGQKTVPLAGLARFNNKYHPELHRGCCF